MRRDKSFVCAIIFGTIVFMCTTGSSRSSHRAKDFGQLATGQQYRLCFFSFNHTAFKLCSLWHVGYLHDDFYGFHICSRASFLLYNPARRPDSIEPPRLLGSMPSYFSVAVVMHPLLTLRCSPLPLLPLRPSGPVAQYSTSRLCYFRLPASCLLRSAPRIRACLL
jgi:hypothetical protein